MSKYNLQIMFLVCGSPGMTPPPGHSPAKSSYVRNVGTPETLTDSHEICVSILTFLLSFINHNTPQIFAFLDNVHEISSLTELGKLTTNVRDKKFLSTHLLLSFVLFLCKTHELTSH
jgi:hypothetical protein